MTATFKRLSEVKACDELARLYSELTGRDITPDTARINALIGSGRLAFYGAFADDRLIGMTSIIPCSTGIHDKLWIEDVAVLSPFRGRGTGRALLEFAMSDAAELFGPGTFWLTSRPSRTAARALYASLGFVPHETGIFYKKI